MSKKNNNGLIPKLRFPKFRRDGVWAYQNGNLLFEPISNKNHNSDLPILAITQEQGAVPRNLIDYHISVTDKSIESYKVVEVGDFIISLRSFQGGIEYSAYKGICSPAYIILRKKSNDIHNHFYKYFFKSKRFIKEMNRNLEGIRDGKMVSYDQFSELFLPFPSTLEQQRIADFLSSLDDLITAESQKLFAYKAHKNGLMQELFPAEGETVPKLRFREFRGKEEWEEKELGQIGELISGLTYSPNDIDENGVLVLRSSNIQNNRLAFEDNVYVRTNSFNPVEEEDILICVRNGSRNLIGKNAIITKKYVGLAFGAFMTVYRSKCNKFLIHWFSSDQYYEKVKQNLGATINSINGTDLKKFLVLIPSPAEQQRIAGCLSSLDELITAQAQKIEALKKHKKGLMQGLFPSLEGLDK
jgi:type I restriction enzyme, S subunit